MRELVKFLILVSVLPHRFGKGPHISLKFCTVLSIVVTKMLINFTLLPPSGERKNSICFLIYTILEKQWLI